MHGLPSSTETGTPRQAPHPSQASFTVQAFPSEHSVPPAAGVCETPLDGLQLSIVHGLPSSMGTGVCTHPDPDHESVVHALLSLQSQVQGPHVRSVRQTWDGLSQPVSLHCRVLPVVQIPWDRVSTTVRTGVSKAIPPRQPVRSRTNGLFHAPANGDTLPIVMAHNFASARFH